MRMISFYIPLLLCIVFVAVMYALVAWNIRRHVTVQFIYLYISYPLIPLFASSVEITEFFWLRINFVIRLLTKTLTSSFLAYFKIWYWYNCIQSFLFMGADNDSMKSRADVLVAKQLQYPLAFVLIWIFPTINRIHNWVIPFSFNSYSIYIHPFSSMTSKLVD
jgi:hypothetical protein